MFWDSIKSLNVFNIELFQLSSSHDNFLNLLNINLYSYFNRPYYSFHTEYTNPCNDFNTINRFCITIIIISRIINYTIRFNNIMFISLLIQTKSQEFCLHLIFFWMGVIITGLW